MSEVYFDDCAIEKLIGIGSKEALSECFANCEIEKYESIENLAKLKALDLSPKHKILLTIIQKTFFQPGAGRKEEALTRGFGQIAKKKDWEEVLSLLLKEGILDIGEGKEGKLYIPVRKNARRMKNIKEKMTYCGDELWERLE
ncbi:hypothetical protein [Hyphobacterium sp.]|uniref:hypothetical protein n=1 Tax=Hyphobacterium sp. TaxID=2004662 RepID=UPI003748E373